MRILAIWFGVAAVVGLLLGYAARRLKGVPKGRGRSIKEDNTEGSGAESELMSSVRSSAETKKR